jgi:multiple sugar transport system permease protein
MTRSEKNNLLKGLAFISPWIIGFLFLTLYPVFISLYYSFCDYDVLAGAHWNGGQNYLDMLHDTEFWRSLKNTFIYAGLSLPLGMVFSLFIAVLLNMKIVGRSIFRTIYFLPSMIPLVAGAMVWNWIFNGEYGVLNYAINSGVADVSWFVGNFLHLHSLGAEIGQLRAPQWLADPMWTKPALVTMSIWGIGGQIVIYLAALQDVPKHLIESAEIDGAGWWARLWHVTIPMISPVIYFNLIIGIIGSLQVFVQPYIMMGEGGPGHSAYLYTWYLYDNAFTFLNMGYASALAWLLFVIIIVLTWIATSASRKHIYYGGA